MDMNTENVLNEAEQCRNEIHKELRQFEEENERFASDVQEEHSSFSWKQAIINGAIVGAIVGTGYMIYRYCTSPSDDDAVESIIDLF